MNKLFTFRNIKLKDESFIRIDLIVFSLVVYYKKKYGIKIGIGIHNIIVELSMTNWTHSPLYKALEEFTEKD
tara:strand:- start:114 stop:329 length:216 start_codon:yes stop_codon:yes gene_type:complete